METNMDNTKALLKVKVDVSIEKKNSFETNNLKVIKELEGL
jgi:hypothetical protein